MLKERRAAAETVANDLHEAEMAIDAAITRVAKLVGRLPETRSEIKVACVVGHAAIERATDCLQGLALARRSIIDAHAELATAKGQIGLGAVAVGDLGEKPPVNAQHGRHLEVVAGGVGR